MPSMLTEEQLYVLTPHFQNAEKGRRLENTVKPSYM